MVLYQRRCYNFKFFVDQTRLSKYIKIELKWKRHQIEITKRKQNLMHCITLPKYRDHKGGLILLRCSRADDTNRVAMHLHNERTIYMRP